MKQNTVSRRIADELKARIRSGRLRPGERVPSAREIVREHGVAIATATKVLALLRKDGLVRPKPGIGTIVRASDTGHEATRELVVRTAIAIADEEGIDALSLRSVATELGIATVTLQRHVASKDELVLAMTDAALGEVALPGAGRDDWRQTLEDVARALWASHRQHRWLVHVLSMTRPQFLENGMRMTERVLAAIDTLGLGPEATLRHGVALLAYVCGMAAGLEAERRAEQDTGMTSDEWMEARQDAFAPYARRFPMLGRLSRAGDVDMSHDALFSCGLERFLDGLAAARGAETRPKREKARARSLRADVA